MRQRGTEKIPRHNGILNRSNASPPALLGRKLDYIVEDQTDISAERDNIEDHELIQIEKDIIDNKLAQLIPRLQRVIEDAALLRTANFIDDRFWGMVLHQAYHREHTQLYDAGYTGSGISYPFSLGLQLGHLARLLAQSPQDLDTQNQLANGFHVGLTGKLLRDPHEFTESKNTNRHDSDSRFINESYVYTINQENPEDLFTPFIETKESINSRFDKKRNVFKNKWSEFIEKSDIPDTEPFMDIVYYIRRAMRFPDYSEGRNTPRNHYIPPHVEGKTHSMDIWNPAFADSDFLHFTRKDDEDSHKEDVEEKIKTALGDRIERVEDLIPKAKNDIEGIVSCSGGKKDYPILAVEVLRAVAARTSPVRIDIIEEVRGPKRYKPKKQEINKVRNYIDKNKPGPETLEWSSFLYDSGSGYKLTKYGKFISLLIFPDVGPRKSDKYLPQKGVNEKYIVPEEEEIRVACHACMLGIPNRERIEILDDALNERLGCSF